MTTQPRFTRGTLFIIIVSLVLLVWRAALFLYTPAPLGDAIWYLGQTYAYLSGHWLSVPFSFGYLQPYLLPYLYGILSMPFFAVFGASNLSLLAWNLLLLILIGGLVLRLCQRFQLQSIPLKLLLVMVFITSIYLYGPRPEVLNLVFLLIILSLFIDGGERPTSARLIIAGGLVAVMGLVQPVGGVFGVLLIVIYGGWQRLPVRFFAITLGAVAVTVAVLYAPVIAVDPQQWFADFFVRHGMGDTRSAFDPLLYVKYSLLNPFIWVPFGAMLVMLVQQGRARRAGIEIGLVVGLVVILTLFSRSYYFPYLTVYMVWRILANGLLRLPLLIAVPVLLVIPFFSHYWVTVQTLDSPDYGQQVRAAQAAVAGYFEDEGASIIWVDATTALVAIESPRARFYFTYYRRMAQVGITLAPGDVMLFTNENVAKASLINLDTPFEDLELREIVPPSARGLRALGESGTENEAVGLWELRRK